MSDITIVDYGAGNIRSVRNALLEMGREAVLAATPEAVKNSGVIVLPGVGAFGEAMERLHASGLATALQDHVAQGKPVLGICLGMQLFCSESEEHGIHQGFNWIQARVVPFSPHMGLKIPHMGWNEIHKVADHPLFHKVEDRIDTYFVHSYYVAAMDRKDVLAYTPYGIDFASIIGRDNVLGMQFHPEKSQAPGLQLLQNALELLEAL